jgi:polyhydroxybutyrate depolymerase
MRRTLWVLGLCVVLVPASYAQDFDVDLGRGAVPVLVPDSYDPAEPLPLVISLHGYTGWGAANEAWMQFGRLVDEQRFVYTYPDGLMDFWGARYWNATDYCCDSTGLTDDSGYLKDLVDTIKDTVSIDEKRVYFVGHSNGGFMSYRMACDHSEMVAAVASLAGATFDRPADCGATEPVHALQIHGTYDATILYDGDCYGGACYPSAKQTVRQWATLAECEMDIERGPYLDLDSFLPGNDTATYRVEECLEGGSAALWMIRYGSHSPWLTENFAEEVLAYFYAHPKP